MIGLAGSLSSDYAVVLDHGLDAVFSALPRCMDMSQALASAAENLTAVSRNLATVLAMKVVPE